MEDITYTECNHEYVIDGICQVDNCQFIFVDSLREGGEGNKCVIGVSTKNVSTSLMITNAKTHVKLV